MRKRTFPDSLPGMGRPKTMATRKPVSLPPELSEAVDDYRFANRFRTESEAIRHLIELGLEAAKRSGAKPKPKAKKP
jgi:Arc/MetJ-type ribon-helix-helix transcriptional regulator